MRGMPKTAKCEDCGKRVNRYLGATSRYPQGVRTNTLGYVCGECMVERAERHERLEAERDRES